MPRPIFRRAFSTVGGPTTSSIGTCILHENTRQETAGIFFKFGMDGKEQWAFLISLDAFLLNYGKKRLTRSFFPIFSSKRT